MAEEKRPGKKMTLKERLKEYSINETTLHGLRYIAADGRITVRKLAWIIVVLTASAVMTFFIVVKLMQYYERSTTTDIGMEYKDNMDFPAVVVCNQNPLRRSQVFNAGMYDVVREAYQRKYYKAFADDTGGCIEDYLLYDDICFIPDEAVFKFDLKDVSKSVCEHTCTNLENTRCSGYLYNVDSKMCVLTSFTGELSNNGCQGSRDMFFRRKRCLQAPFLDCTFEDADPYECSLQDLADHGDHWAVVSGREAISDVDHTLGSAQGHSLALIPKMGNGSSAAYKSPFMDTAGKCIMLFYRHLGSTTSSIEIIITEENLHENTLVVRTGSGSAAWTPLFLHLPAGVIMIGIIGKVQQGSRGIAVDDIELLPCAYFEKECVSSFTGSEYMGKIDHSITGKPCLPWPRKAEYFKDMFVDGSAQKAQRYCRNPDARDSGPWCFTNEAEQETCHIPYCECSQLSATCQSSGRCLQPGAVCNGHLDCEDGSDEADRCEDHMHMECEFETPFICGYVAYPTSKFFWDRSNLMSDTWTRQTQSSADNYFYMKVVQGANSKYGDTAVLRSVEHYIELDSYLSFYVRMKVSSDDLTTRLNVRLLNPLGTVSKTILSVRQRSDSTWVKYYVAIPAGTYTIVFEAIRGRSSSDIALDSVVFVQDPQSTSSDEQIIHYDDIDYASGSGYYDEDDLVYGVDSFLDSLNLTSEVLMPAVTKQNTTGENTMGESADMLTCDFNPEANCTEVYVNRPESQLYQWAIMPRQFVSEAEHRHQGCRGNYAEFKGAIESPGFPERYYPSLKCSYTIHQPRGSNMTVSFKWFDLEKEEGCTYDSLKIDGKTICGNLKVPPIHTDKEQFRFTLKTDSSVERTGFQLVYQTTAVDTVDYVIAAGFHMEWSYRSYRSRLSSPTFKLYETHCLVFELYVSTIFEAKLVARQEKDRPQLVLLRTQYLGETWHKISIQLPATEQYVGVPLHLLFDTFHNGPEAHTAALDNIHVVQGKCENTQGNEYDSVDCDFTDVHQCGYVDVSEGPLRWTRSHRGSKRSGTFFMMCDFNQKIISNTAALLTPKLSVARKKCLFLDLRSHGGFTAISVGRYSNSTVTDTLVVLHEYHMKENTAITVSLPRGEYKIILEATGRDSDTRLYRVWTEDAECNSTKPYAQDDLEEDIHAENATDFESPSKSTLTARCVESNLTSAEIKEQNYKRMLQLIDVPLADFVETLSIKQDDFLPWCNFNGDTCQPEYLSMDYTDVGLCLFFNINETNPLVIKKAGAAGGLHMLLNVGEYDAIQGLGMATGVKVEVFSQKKTPNLRDKGFIIGPGMKTFASLTYTEISAMKAPYGECGKRSLPHYPDSDYYHWKCRRDCDAIKLENACGCRDLYMPEYGNFPVCSTEQFLDCVIHGEDNSTAHPCRECPSDCYIEDYSVQLSYALISEPIVARKIANKKQRIQESLINATNTWGRLTQSDMNTVLSHCNALRAVLKSAQLVIEWDIQKPLESVFNRVKKGLNAIVSMATGDIEKVLLINFDEQKKAYKTFFDANITLLIDAGGETVRSLSYVEHAMKDWRLKLPELGTEDSLNYSIDSAKIWLFKAQSVLQSTSFLLSRDMFDVKFAVLPVNLFGNKARMEKCNSNMEIFSYSVKTMASMIEKLYAEYVDQANKTAQLSKTIENYKNNWHSAKGCLLDYGNFLESVDGWLKSVSLANEAKKISESLIPRTLFGDMMDYLRKVERIYEGYAKNLITKETFPGLLAKTRRRDMVSVIEDLQVQTQQLLTNPMRSVLKDTENAVADYYRSGLKYLAEMSPFYDYGQFDPSLLLLNRAQRLSLWKKPYTSLENPDILGYLSEDIEQYSTFVYADKTLSNQSERDIVSFLENCMSGLFKPLDDLDRALLDNADKVWDVYEDLWDHLDIYQSTTQIDSTFMKKNFIEIDVYFSELKVSTISQAKGYDIGAFFADMGGYVGLLLGASVVTIVEVIDLFLDYFFGKYLNKDVTSRVKHEETEGVTHPNLGVYDGFALGPTAEKSDTNNFTRL